MLDFINAGIDRITIHTILLKTDDQDHSDYNLSDDLIAPQGEAILSLKRRVNQAISKNTKCFKLDISATDTNSFFSLARTMKECATNHFIQVSRQLAIKLAEEQKRGSIPAGYLLIADGYNDNKHFVLIIKAEPHEAFQTRTNPNGGRTLELLTDIFLSPSAKLFKIGLLYQDTNEGKPTPNDIYSCLLFDDHFQATSMHLADYFYRGFLGLTTDANSKMRTKEFHDDFQSFIWGLDVQAEVKLELSNLIEVYLTQDQTGIVDASLFSDTYLEEDIRNSFREEFLDKYPIAFEKDITLVERAITGRKIVKFSNSIKLSGSRDEFNNKIEIITLPEEMEHANLQGKTMVLIAGYPYSQ